MQATDMTKGFTIIRYIEASPEQVWHAWTVPDLIAHWWHLPLTSTPREELEFDVRPGGYYIYTSIHHETEERMVSGGVYQEVQPYDHLVFTWGAPGLDPEALPLITVRLDRVSDGTHMSLELRGLPGQPGDNSYYDTWDVAVANLKAYLSPENHGSVRDDSHDD